MYLGFIDMVANLGEVWMRIALHWVSYDVFMFFS